MNKRTKITEMDAMEKKLLRAKKKYQDAIVAKERKQAVMESKLTKMKEVFGVKNLTEAKRLMKSIDTKIKKLDKQLADLEGRIEKLMSNAA